jgi:hypothetical protein
MTNLARAVARDGEAEARPAAQGQLTLDQPAEVSL